MIYFINKIRLRNFWQRTTKNNKKSNLKKITSKNQPNLFLIERCMSELASNGRYFEFIPLYIVKNKNKEENINNTINKIYF